MILSILCVMALVAIICFMPTKNCYGNCRQGRDKCDQPCKDKNAKR
jgi:hypothetical protein